MIYMNTYEDLADKVRNAADNSDAARIIEDFVTEYGCSIAEKNEFNIANVSVPLPTKVYEVTFGVHLAARIKATGSNIEVENAVNGWGDPIPLDQVEVFDRQ